MSKQQMTAALVCSWTPVTDASGRTSLEARWTTAAVAAVRSAA